MCSFFYAVIPDTITPKPGTVWDRGVNHLFGGGLEILKLDATLISSCETNES